MGDSGKQDASGQGVYSFSDHRVYLDELLYGLDVIQEDSPHEIGEAVAGFVKSIRS